MEKGFRLESNGLTVEEIVKKLQELMAEEKIAKDTLKFECNYGSDDNSSADVSSDKKDNTDKEEFAELKEELDELLGFGGGDYECDCKSNEEFDPFKVIVGGISIIIDKIDEHEKMLSDINKKIDMMDEFSKKLDIINKGIGDMWSDQDDQFNDIEEELDSINSNLIDISENKRNSPERETISDIIGKLVPGLITINNYGSYINDESSTWNNEPEDFDFESDDE